MIYNYNHLHVRYESVKISQLSVLFLVSTNKEQQFTYLSSNERCLIRHHIFAKIEIPWLHRSREGTIYYLFLQMRKKKKRLRKNYFAEQLPVRMQVVPRYFPHIYAPDTAIVVPSLSIIGDKVRIHRRHGL